MKRCPRCGRWFFGEDLHTCPPEWIVWDAEDNEADGLHVFALGPEEAIVEWARLSDEGMEYIIADGEYVQVKLRRADRTKVLRGVVDGERVVEYTANLLLGREN